MKYLFIFSLLAATTLSAQELQLHYDPRHTLDPSQNAHNFPTLYFQYFKLYDSGHAFIKPGSFLLKLQTDLNGSANNIGQSYVQVSQSFRFWTPKIFITLQYNGGLGVTEPKQYSYYINNAYSAGLAYTFSWKGAWLSPSLNYKYTPYSKPSHDPSLTLYWWRGYFHYKLEFAGDFTLWTEDKDHGDAATAGQRGKRFFFFAEPQLWYNIDKVLAVGTKANMFYRIITQERILQVYPTAAVRFKL